MNRNFKDDGNIPDQILDFISSNSHNEISLEDFILEHTNKRGLHNHTIENLYLYFHLEKHLLKNRVVVYPNTVFIVDNRSHKFFITDSEDVLSNLNFAMITDIKLRKKFRMYSSHIQNISKEHFTLSKMKEFVYDLNYILSEQAYRDRYVDNPKKAKKKIYQRLKYPINTLLKLDFEERDITEENLQDALDVHEQWKTFKENDPNVFQMMFSSNRYNKAIEKMFDLEYLSRDNFYAKIFYLDSKPIAVRQCLLKDDISYDIGFFSLYWNLPSNIVNHINTFCLLSLKNLGINRHNCGMAFDKKNSISKAHFPGEYETIYSYKLR